MLSDEEIEQGAITASELHGHGTTIGTMWRGRWRVGQRGHTDFYGTAS